MGQTQYDALKLEVLTSISRGITPTRQVSDNFHFLLVVIVEDQPIFNPKMHDA